MVLICPGEISSSLLKKSILILHLQKLMMKRQISVKRNTWHTSTCQIQLKKVEVFETLSINLLIEFSRESIKMTKA
jgi:hypothetical protein